MSAAAAATTRTDHAAAGEEAHGDFRCADCGYGVVSTGALPSCPMCRGAIWHSVRRPFRSGALRVTAVSR